MMCIVGINRVGAVLCCWLVSSGLGADELSDWSNESADSAIQATRLSHSKFRTAAAVTVVTQNDIRHRGYLTVHDIFRDIPGFRVSWNGSDKRVSYHGTAVRQDRRLRVTINGVNALIGDAEYVEFNRLPFVLEDIAEITVTRGSNGASYGDNAFLASIDFQLKNASQGRGTGVAVGVGDLKRRNVSAFVNRHSENYSVLFSANKYSMEEYAKQGIPPIDNDDGEHISRINLSATNGLSRKSPLEINLQWYEADHNVENTISTQEGEQLNRGYGFSMSQKYSLGDNQHIDWVISHNRQKERIINNGCLDEALERFIEGMLPEQSEELLSRATALSAILQRPFDQLCGRMDIEIKSNRTDAEMEYNKIVGPVELAVGGSATYIDAISDEYFVDRETQENYRLFGEAAYDLNDFTFHLGAMAQDANNVDDVQFAGRLAANWQFVKNQSLRVVMSEAFRIPSLIESDASWSVEVELADISLPGFDGGVDIAGRSGDDSSKVQPERIRSYEIGHFMTFADLGIKLDTKLFREEIKHPIEYAIILFGELPENGSAFTLSGAETEFEYKFSHRIKMRGTYSFVDTTAPSGFQREFYGRHAGSLVAQMRLRDDDGISLGYYGNTKIGGIDFSRFDLVYNWKTHIALSRLDVRLVAQHFMNKQQGSKLDHIGNNSLVNSFDKATQLFLQCELHW